MSAVSRESATALHDATHPLERLVMSGGLPETLGHKLSCICISDHPAQVPRNHDGRGTDRLCRAGEVKGGYS